MRPCCFSPCRSTDTCISLALVISGSSFISGSNSSSTLSDCELSSQLMISTELMVLSSLISRPGTPPAGSVAPSIYIYCTPGKSETRFMYLFWAVTHVAVNAQIAIRHSVRADLDSFIIFRVYCIVGD